MPKSKKRNKQYKPRPPAPPSTRDVHAFFDGNQEKSRPKVDLDFVDVEYLGRTWEIDAEALDDWELIESLTRMQSANGSMDIEAGIDAMRRLMGIEQYEALKELMRGENGRISAIGFSNALSDLFALLTAKNESGNS